MSEDKPDNTGGRLPEPPGDTPPTDTPEEELVADDDRVIGRAFRLSLAVIAGVGLLVLAGLALSRRTPEAAPEQVIDTAAPRTVEKTSTMPDVSFTDVTGAWGIDFTHFNGAYGDKLLPETMGGGVGIFDYDGDDDPDLLFVNSSNWSHRLAPAPPPTMALYENRGGGRFVDVTLAAGLAVPFYGQGVAVGDYDGDGRRDLFLTAVGRNRLFRNLGGRFEEVTDRAGVGGANDAWSTGATFLDHDGDGDLDLFVGNYVVWSKEIDFEVDYRLTGVGRAYGPPQNYEGTFSYLYRNNGDGTFTDVSAEAGVQVVNPVTGVPAGKALGLAPIDVDEDGALDVFVANDTVRNFFFRNLGDGTFEEVGEFYGLGYDREGNATGAMGADAGFYRNDRNLGIAIGNFANEMTSVYVTQDDPSLFVDEAISEGIGAASRRSLTFGLLFLDYDLDGRLDLLQANGHLEEEIGRVDPSQSYRQPAQLFWNAGPDAPQGFLPVPAENVGDLARPIVGRAAAAADLDADGDLDVVLTQTGGPALVLRNDQTLGHHWLRVRLEDSTSPNRDAYGARVLLTANGRTQERIVMPTRSYLTQVESSVTFGLGASTAVEELTIIWPDGERETLPVATVDREQLVRRADS